jgi:transposase-like protein
MKEMGKRKEEGEVSRQRFSEDFKHQALLRAARAGIPATALDLGLAAAQLYA